MTSLLSDQVRDGLNWECYHLGPPKCKIKYTSPHFSDAKMACVDVKSPLISEKGGFLFWFCTVTINNALS